MVRLSDEELIDLFGRQLPDVLERRPDLEPVIYNVFLKVLVRKEEVAAGAFPFFRSGCQQSEV
jgi:hypothetical protein